ncbi:MAG: tetratricopeptide repeat protein [Spirochaetota bacterium]
MQEGTTDAVDNLKNLFLSGELANLDLAFLILQGTGLHTELYSHILALQLFHPQSKIRRKAGSSLRKNTQEDFQLWLKSDILDRYTYASYKKLSEKQFCTYIEELAKNPYIQVEDLGSLSFVLLKKGTKYALAHSFLGKHFILQTFYTNNTLSLQNQYLDKLPQEIGMFPEMRTLHLGGNEFTEIPDSIRNLQRLEKITYQDTPISERSLKLLDSLYSSIMSQLYYEKACDFIDRKMELEEARRLLNRAIKLKPDSGNYWNAKGVVYQNFQKYNSADECFNKALLFEPDMPLAWSNKSYGFFKTKKISESLEVAEEGLKRFPKNGNLNYKASLLFRKAQALYNMNQYSKAETAYLQSLQIDAKNWATHYNLACIYSALKDNSKAAKYLYQALQANPRYAAQARQNAFFNKIMQEDNKFNRF